MHQCIDAVYGCEDAFQRQFFDREFNSSDTSVVTISNLVIGVFELVEDCEGYFLKRTEIRPNYQSEGIGSSIVKDILVHADLEQKNTGGCKGFCVTALVKHNPPIAVQIQS